ncbi:hypothetical protein FACS1894167_01870 [Synergistales bacterium]|nr:hypothetical protein FACS1894167_01870 [Synergistales bacterium]
MPRLYLVIGSGTAQRKLLSSVREELRGRGYEDMSRLEGVSWLPLLSENMGGGLFSEKSVIIIEDAEQLGRFPEKLTPLLEPEGADVVILLVYKSDPAMGKEKQPALLPKGIIPLCARHKAPDEPSPWSRERDDIIIRAAKREGARVAEDAAALLKELFEDTGEMESEACKLALFCRFAGRSEISLGDAASLCLADGSRDTLKLLDGICERRTREILPLLESLRESAELLQLVSALHNRLRCAMYMAAFPKEGAAFMKAFGTSSYAARLAEKAARSYGREKLIKCVAGLIRINVNEKSGAGASWHDLSILIIDLMS